MIYIDGSEFNKTSGLQGSGAYSANAAGIGAGSTPGRTSINVAENKKSEAAQTAFAGVVVSGAAVDKKAMDQNTYNSLMKEADDIKSQIMQSATDAKANLKNLFNRLSGADAVKINEDGFNLNDLSQEDCVNIVDRIKIELAAYNENYRVYAGDIDVDKIQEVVGSEAFAQHVAGQLGDSGVPSTDANIDAVAAAVDKLSDLKSSDEYQVSMDAKVYMVSNKCAATLDNIQIAEHAYKIRQGNMSDREWNELKPQIENVIKKAGLDVNKSNLANAKALLMEDMPVTEDNLKYMAAVDEINFSKENVAEKTIDAIKAGIAPENAVLTNQTDVYGNVAKALDTLDKIAGNEAVCVKMAQEMSDDGIVSLKSLDEAYGMYVADTGSTVNQADTGNAVNEDGSDAAGQGESGHNDRQQSSTRMLLEIQILMTAEAGINIEKNGLNINTVSIATLHEHLLAYDKEIFMDELGKQLAHDIDSDELYNTAFNTREALYNIGKSPVEMIGALYSEIAYSAGAENVVTVMSAAKTGMSIRARLNKAGVAYETMEGTVRGDLGDSADRAVEASAGAMLSDMGMEDNKSNREAVGILVKNNMDVTKDNVMNIKELKSALDSLVANMNPETVLDMIRNNVNPYTTDIREVNEYLKAENEKNGRDTDDKYSTFLYKLDRTNGITAKERRQFIGIYKMMNMFTKDAGKAVGALAAQGADITMSNLVSAYNSRKSYNNIDMSVDDVSDINVSVYENYYTNLFMTTGDKITPNTLKNVNDNKPIYERSVENFCEAADELYDAAAEAAYMDEYMELVRQVAEADSAVINELEHGGEDITLNNIQAMEQLMMSDLFNNRFGIDNNRARDIFDSLDDREKLTAKISSLCDEASDKLAEEIEKDDNSYDVVKSASITQMTAQMMVRSTRREDYTIPYIKGDGIGMMKVSFKSDSEQSGKISISYEDSMLGNVNVNISVGDSDIQISALYETKASIRGLADKQETEAADEFKDKLENAAQLVKDNYGCKRADVIINPVRNVERNIYNSEETQISSAILYKIAKTVVEGLV